MISTNNHIKLADEELKKVNASAKETRIAAIYENGELDLKFAYDRGEKIGIAEGKAEGKAKGKYESKLEIAKALLINKVDFVTIIKST